MSTTRGRMRGTSQRSRVVGLLALWLLAATWGCGEEEQATPLVGSASEFARTFGFQFANYNNSEAITNLTATEMQGLFGSRVCATGSGESCQLTTNAERWMTNLNKAMDAGHCFGMATTSLLILDGELSPTAYQPDATRTFDLELEDNDRLQRQIAYAMALQLLDEVKARDFGSWGTRATPREVVDHLQAGLDRGERYVVGFDKRGGGGHAITVFGLRKGAEPGIREIVTYDNNFPGRETVISVDVVANTWSYDNAATNPDNPPDIWEGDAETFSLSVLPLSALVGLDPETTTCPGSVCGSYDGGAIDVRTLSATGTGSILVTDGQGRRIGVDGANTYDEIPSAVSQTVRGCTVWDDTPPPTLELPGDQTYTVKFAANALSEGDPSGVWLAGTGFIAGVEGMVLDPGQEDLVVFAREDLSVSYETRDAETVDAVLSAMTGGEADWELRVRAHGESMGQRLLARAEVDRSRLHIQLDDFDPADDEGAIELQLERSGGGRTLSFASSSVAVPYGAALSVAYGSWDQDGEELSLEVDIGADGYDEGQGDYTLTLEDEGP